MGVDGSGLTHSSIKGSYRSCQMLMKKVKCVDHEKTIYLNWSKSYDWSEVNDKLEGKKDINDEV